jgi:hypothetical protein
MKHRDRAALTWKAFPDPVPIGSPFGFPWETFGLMPPEKIRAVSCPNCHSGSLKVTYTCKTQGASANNAHLVSWRKGIGMRIWSLVLAPSKHLKALALNNHSPARNGDVVNGERTLIFQMENRSHRIEGV